MSSGTAFGSLSTLQKRLYLDQVANQARMNAFWLGNGFVSANEKNTGLPVTRVTQFTDNGRGTSCIMPMVPDLPIDGGVVGDEVLEGNEDTLDSSAQTIRIDRLRRGVKAAGAMAEQETVVRFRAQAQDKLAYWKGDVLDELMFLTASGRAYTQTTDGAVRGASPLPRLKFAADVTAASTNRVLYAGSATSEATLTAGDTYSWNLVVKANAFAKRKGIAPIRMGGREYYAHVLSTEQMRDLVQSADYKAILSTAEARGKGNPLFDNAKAVINGAILYEHQKVYHTTGGTAWGAGNTVDGAQALLLGAQALGYAELRLKDKMTESSSNDYGDKPGLGVENVVGLLKPQWPSKYDANSVEDAGIVSIKTAAAE